MPHPLHTAGTYIYSHGSGRESFFEANWARQIARCQASLDSDDLETTQRFTSWADIKEELLDSLPPSIILIQPSLRHLSHFFAFFETKLGPKLDASFLWGVIACLSQVSANSGGLLCTSVVIVAVCRAALTRS